MTLETVDRRVLGALRLVDAATNLRIRSPLTLQAPGVVFRQNGSGLWIIRHVPGFETYEADFDLTQPAPPIGSVAVQVTVRDPLGDYLARSVTIQLPRDPNPANAGQATSLFRPMDVPMYLAPAAPTASAWALVRASVRAQSTNRPLGGALLRVVRISDNTRLALGLSDERGEALVPIPGIPVTTFGASAGPVLVFELDARLEVFADPAATGPPDPESLETRRATLRSTQQNVKLASGRTLVINFSLNMS